MRAPLGSLLFALVVLASLVMLFAPGSDVPSGFPGSDKIVHFSLFAVLAVTGLRAGIRAVPLGLGLVGYAATSEVLQAVLPINRDGDVRDAAADVLGLAVGLALVTTARRGRDRSGKARQRNLVVRYSEGDEPLRTEVRE